MVSTLVGRVPMWPSTSRSRAWSSTLRALLQDRVPNQRATRPRSAGGWLHHGTLPLDWTAWRGFSLRKEGVFDGDRLPTDAVLAVIAALWTHLPTSPDELGNAKATLRRYLWRSFFTDRYEQASATAALADYRALRQAMSGERPESEVPVFMEDECPLASLEQIIAAGWPKGRNILARGVLALTTKVGARDIADDSPATRKHLKQREYHHLFPAALLREADLSDGSIYRCLNCALVTWRTNRALSCKEPLQYLRERAEANALGEPDLVSRLMTHIVPYGLLRVGEYSGLDEPEKKARVRHDYERFLVGRAVLIRRAMDAVCSGGKIDVSGLHDVPVRTRLSTFSLTDGDAS